MTQQASCRSHSYFASVGMLYKWCFCGCWIKKKSRTLSLLGTRPTFYLTSGPLRAAGTFPSPTAPVSVSPSRFLSLSVCLSPFRRETWELWLSYACRNWIFVCEWRTVGLWPQLLPVGRTLPSWTWALTWTHTLNLSPTSFSINPGTLGVVICSPFLSFTWMMKRPGPSFCLVIHNQIQIHTLSIGQVDRPPKQHVYNVNRYIWYLDSCRAVWRTCTGTLCT